MKQKYSRNNFIASFFLLTLALIAGMACLCSCGSEAGEAGNESSDAGTCRIMIGADLHYLAPDLMPDRDFVQRMCEGSDGKMTDHSEEIADAFLERVIAEHPDALILPGDLTFNGEIVSLRKLAVKLKAVEKEGIPVLVIPGNHDIECRYACRYESGQAAKVKNISRTDFHIIMDRFGYDQAKLRDPQSFSYACDIGPDLRLVFIDVNGDKREDARMGSASAGLLEWLKKTLEDSAAAGKTVISVSHQNVLRQSDFLYEGYVMDNGDAVADLLEAYGVPLNLSGHSHMQHTAKAGNMQDICTGILSGGSMNYGELEYRSAAGASEEKKAGTAESAGTGLDYRFCHLDARDLQKESARRGELAARTQVSGILDYLDREVLSEPTDEELRGEMIDLAVSLNAEYFSGELTEKKAEQYRKSAACRKWMERPYAEEFWGQYIKSMLDSVLPEW